MGQQRGSRVFIGVALGVVAALGVTQPGASAESPASTTADGFLQPGVEMYPTVCPKPTAGTGADAVQDPCEPTDPDSDGDGWFDYEDNCPNTSNPGQEDADGDGIGDVCDPTPTGEPTTPPTTAPPTTTPPTTAPPTTVPPTAQPPAPTATPTTPAPTAVPPPTPGPGCQVSCAYVRQVELRVTASKLKGLISSPAVGCRSAATVTVWRKKKGEDRRLVVLSSRDTGTFHTRRPARAGRYYVTVTSPEQPLCASTTSTTVRVKRS